MSDLLIKISQASLLGIIPIGIGVGLLGSLHCIGMCGAFATSCSTKKSHSISYHLGKITSYGVLGGTAAFLGASFSYIFENPYFKAIPAVLMGLLFVWLGLKSYYTKRPLIKLSGPIKSWVERNLGRSYQKEAGQFRSFSIGFFSAFLPCGLLYGTLLAFAALQSPVYGVVGMISFSIGTIPGLTIAPQILIKILRPLKESWPKLSNFALIGLGILTISYRMVIAYGQATCH